MKSKSVFAAAALLAAAAFSPLGAQKKPASKQLEVTARNLTARDQAVAAKRPADSLRAVLPGDVVEYLMVFTNARDFEIRNVTFDNPVPDALTYVIGTAKSDRPDVTVEYSIDRGKSWSTAPTVEVVVNGQKVRQSAPPEMYTNVRWTVAEGVAPGAQVIAQYRARARGPAGTAPSRQAPVK